MKVDHAGRVVLPKAVRDELGLAAGDTLDFAVHDGEVTLRPKRSGPALEKERGVWVLRTGGRLTAAETNDVIEKMRAVRHPAIPGRER